MEQESEKTLRQDIARTIRWGKGANLQPLPSPEQKLRQTRHLEDAGMRKLPYPFSSAVTITSDTDGTTLDRYKAYTKQLVRDNGLDFGDSIWLSKRNDQGKGLSLLNSRLQLPTDCTEEQCNFSYLMREIHAGNIDHWHAFLEGGPRILILDDLVTKSEYEVQAKIPPERNTGDFFHSTHGFPVFAISVFVSPDHDETIEEAVVCSKIDSSVDRYQEIVEDAGLARRKLPEGTLVCFENSFAIRSDDLSPPLLEDINYISIRFSRPFTEIPVRRIYLHNIAPTVLLKRLHFFADELNFSPCLLTQHGMWHFYNTQRLISENQRNGKVLEKELDYGRSYYGSFDKTLLRFSTLSDEPHSFARVVPEIFSALKIRFLRMTQGADYLSARFDELRTTKKHCDLLDVVYPAMSRGNHAFYNLCAAFPSLPDECRDDPQLVPDRSIAGNFLLRLQVILDNLKDYPGEIAVFYTHLGNWGPWPNEPNKNLASPTLSELRERVFNVSGSVANRNRIWFARASVVCDYALMVQSLPEFVRRMPHDEILIDAWDDPVLEASLPLSRYQLYGITFYVNDAGRANVRWRRSSLDITRNPPDDTGKESVTIVECGITISLIDELDPKRSRELGQYGGEWHSDARWEWHAGRGDAFRGTGFATICFKRLPAKGGILDKFRRPPSSLFSPTTNTTIFSCKGLYTDGAQQFAYALRRSHSSALFGLIIETSTGGRFYFGDEELLETAGDVHAYYTFGKGDYRRSGVWQRYCVPLYCLTWTHAAEAPPMPSNPLRHCRLVTRLRRFQSVDVDAVQFGRPKTWVASDHPSFVVGGKATSGKQMVVALRSLYDRKGGSTNFTESTANGVFWFYNVVPGAYEIAFGSTKPTVNWASSKSIDVCCDRFDIVL